MREPTQSELHNVLRVMKSSSAGIPALADDGRRNRFGELTGDHFEQRILAYGAQGQSLKKAVAGCIGLAVWACHHLPCQAASAALAALEPPSGNSHLPMPV